MSDKDKPSRREVLGHAVRGAALVGMGGGIAYLARKSGREGVWTINLNACINSDVARHGVEVCDRCATECVLALSAVRAVNDHAKCGRCYICPAYFDIQSAMGPDGLPSQKLCPRDAIERKVIGWVDEEDPANNYYEYVIDEKRCNGCGKCVMGCKEPNGLSSIRLEVRHDLCVDCNQCAIAVACPDDAYERKIAKET
jgi:electron transport complex protein RnfB